MDSWEKIPSNTRYKWTNATQYMQYQYSVLSRNKSFGGGRRWGWRAPKVICGVGQGKTSRHQGTNLDTKPSKWSMLAFPRGGENIVRGTNAPMPSKCTRGPGNISVSIYTKSCGARPFSFWSCVTTPLKFSILSSILSSCLSTLYSNYYVTHTTRW